MKKYALFLTLAVVSFFIGAPLAHAATKNILLTGYWAPTNQMLTRFSTDPILNPQGWIGKNWKNSGYDVYAYFPQFLSVNDRVGTGDFPVDYAGAYNDFMRITEDLAPIAIISFGNGGNGWRVEQNFPNYWKDFFQNKSIPSVVGETLQYAIPDGLKTDQVFHSTLPNQLIVDQVRSKVRWAFPSNNTRGDPGNFLCGFISYLGGWYHAQHSDPRDPRYNAMTGFIHTTLSLAASQAATLASLDAVVQELRRR